MGGRPLNVFMQSGIEVVAGCPEMEIETIVNTYLNGELVTGENSCGGEHHHCGGHGHDGNHHCHH